MVREGVLDLHNRDDDAVTLSVVFMPQQEWEMMVGLTRKGVDLVCEGICIDYAPCPFEPGTVKGLVHDEDHD